MRRRRFFLLEKQPSILRHHQSLLSEHFDQLQNTDYESSRLQQLSQAEQTKMCKWIWHRCEGTKKPGDRPRDCEARDWTRMDNVQICPDRDRWVRDGLFRTILCSGPCPKREAVLAAGTSRQFPGLVCRRCRQADAEISWEAERKKKQPQLAPLATAVGTGGYQAAIGRAPPPTQT